ncbi:MAG TPA: FAD-binding oxidoreductase [Dehalococcoidia bacterium]|nr:FAD-binding oxidoreductase [Dehalococcoidia bacterium]
MAPGSVEDLRAVMREAHARGLAVIPFGAGRHMTLGNVPTRYDVALSLARIDRIVEHEPADLTVTVEAGCRLGALQAALASHGQFLPLDPPAAGDDATVGGVLAANAQGALRHRFGTARDWLIGTDVVQGDGTLVHAGGRVVKNVAGYDMTKLYAGSLGTLGVIARATFKVAPLPAAETTLAVSCRSAHAAGIVLLSAHDAGLALHCGELLSPAAAALVLGDERWTALVRVSGGARAVERSVREIRDFADGLQETASEREPAPAWAAWGAAFAPAGLSMRASVAPSAVPDAVDALDEALAPAGAVISATLSAGLVRIALPEASDIAARDAYERAEEIARGYGGTLLVDAAPARLKAAIDVFGPARGDFPIMRRLKQQLDPGGSLAPGRFVGRL